MSLLVENSVEALQYLRKLFIGGLSYNTTNESLKEFFEQWGDVINVVVVRDHETKRSRGFGFITYSMSSMVDNAIANKPHKIDGHEVTTRRAIPRNVRDKPNIAWITKKMYVSKIKNQNEEELLEYFGNYGNIISIEIVTNNKTGQRKGYGFIEFDDSDPVDKAVLIQNHQISGTKLVVKKAVNKVAASAFRKQRKSGDDSGKDRNWRRPNNNLGGVLFSKDEVRKLEESRDVGLMRSRMHTYVTKITNLSYCLIGPITGGLMNNVYEAYLESNDIRDRWKNILTQNSYVMEIDEANEGNKANDRVTRNGKHYPNDIVAQECFEMYIKLVKWYNPINRCIFIDLYKNSAIKARECKCTNILYNPSKMLKYKFHLELNKVLEIMNRVLLVNIN